MTDNKKRCGCCDSIGVIPCDHRKMVCLECGEYTNYEQADGHDLHIKELTESFTEHWNVHKSDPFIFDYSKNVERSKNIKDADIRIDATDTKDFSENDDCHLWKEYASKAEKLGVVDGEYLRRISNELRRREFLDDDSIDKTIPCAECGCPYLGPYLGTPDLLQCLRCGHIVHRDIHDKSLLRVIEKPTKKELLKTGEYDIDGHWNYYEKPPRTLVLGGEVYTWNPRKCSNCDEEDDKWHIPTTEEVRKLNEDQKLTKSPGLVKPKVTFRNFLGNVVDAILFAIRK